MTSLDLHIGTVGSNTVELEQKLDNVIKSESPARKKKCALDDLFGEIVNYKRESSMPLDSSPLLWLKVRQKTYPPLGNLFQKYLSIPAMSVASEQVFSTARDLVTAQRYCLSCEQVDSLIFLKKNFDITS